MTRPSSPLGELGTVCKSTQSFINPTKVHDQCTQLIQDIYCTCKPKDVTTMVDVLESSPAIIICLCIVKLPLPLQYLPDKGDNNWLHMQLYSCIDTLNIVWMCCHMVAPLVV